MEQRTRVTRKNGFFKVEESVSSADVKTKGSARNGGAKRNVRIRHKIEAQVHKISRNVERQMSREQYRRMKKLGLV